MFRPLETNTASTITFTFDNQSVSASEGMTIAAALLASGHKSLRENTGIWSGRAARFV